VAEYKRILVLTELRKQSTDLEVHLALITSLVHLGCQDLLYCKDGGQFGAVTLRLFKTVFHFIIYRHPLGAAGQLMVLHLVDLV
jgi:hypothetical protein